jgi:hypothetical protein
MKKGLWIVALLVVAAAALAVVAVKQNRQTAQLKEQLASAATKTLPAPAPQPELPEPMPADKPAEQVAAPPAAVGSAASFFEGFAEMMKDPQMKEVMRIQHKMALDKMYGALFKQFGWPESDIEKLKELLLDRHMALMDTGMSMMSGSATERKQAAEQSKTINAEHDKKIQEFLGQQAYDMFKEYETTIGERVQLQMFKETLPADAALTDQQEADLIAAMYEARKAMSASPLLNDRELDPTQLTEELVAETMKQMEEMQKRYADRAATILSPAQFQQFTKWQQQMSAMQTMGLKMAAKMFKQKTSEPISP